MAAPRKYPDELRERAIREVRATGRPVAHVARDLGIHPEALRGWVRQAETDAGDRDDRLTTAEQDELRQLRKEVAELRRANETSHAPLASSGLGVRDGCRVREGYCLAV
ncbi:transposase [Streptomyces sp. NPDC059866]|uniref:transposase n=1 Tax=Streptomyces sp. NPDC059866 TaxID=3346978 RepID=UPI00366143F9